MTPFSSKYEYRLIVIVIKTNRSILEYPTMPDAETAMARLRELEIRGARPEVVLDDVSWKVDLLVVKSCS